MLETEVVAQQVEPSPQPTSDPVASPEVKKDEAMSPRFAALAKKQRMVEQEKIRLKEEKSKYESEMSELRKWKEEQSKPKPKMNPIEALQAAGFTYEQATDFILSADKPSSESKVKEVESKLEEFIKSQQEREENEKKNAELRLKQQEEEAVKTVHEQIGNFVKTNAEKYELINLYNEDNVLVREVYSLIDLQYQESLKAGTPKIMSYDEACDLMEQYLESELEKAAKTKKLSSKLAPQTEEQTAAQKLTSKTLSNSVTSSPSDPVTSKSDDDRLKRALALLG